MHRNTNVIALLAEKLTERLGDKGSTRPLTLYLWEEDLPMLRFIDFVLDWAGLVKWKAKKAVTMTIRFSPETGYTLDSPSWREITKERGITVTAFFAEIRDRIVKEWEDAHGWESNLVETLQELQSL